MTGRRAPHACIVVVAVSLALSGGCGDGSGADLGGAGDIPDNQAFVTYSSPAGGFSLRVPEGWARTQAAGAVAMVFQGPSLLEPLDVLDNVALPLLLGGATEQEARACARDALGELDLMALSAKLPA